MEWDAAASGRWTRKSGNGYYLATYSASSTRRAALVAKGARAKRLALLVARCPLCGTARVFWNGALIREIPLVAARSRPSELIPVASFPEIRAGKLVVRITSTGKACACRRSRSQPEVALPRTRRDTPMRVPRASRVLPTAGAPRAREPMQPRGRPRSRGSPRAGRAPATRSGARARASARACVRCPRASSARRRRCRSGAG
jgi:hypothetical protein